MTVKKIYFDILDTIKNELIRQITSRIFFTAVEIDHVIFTKQNPKGLKLVRFDSFFLYPEVGSAIPFQALQTSDLCILLDKIGGFDEEKMKEKIHKVIV